MSRNAFASADSVAIKTADPFPELVPIWWRGSLGAFDPRLQKALAPLAHCRLVKTQARCDRAVGHPLIRRQDDLRTHLGIEPNEGGIPGNLHLCIEESEWSQWLYEILSPYVAELVVYRGEWKPGMKRDAIDAHGLAERLRMGQIDQPVYKDVRLFTTLRDRAQYLHDDHARYDPCEAPAQELLSLARPAVHRNCCV